METNLTEKQSLEIISSMINKAKGNFGNNSKHYLLWGWLGMAASISQFVLMQMNVAWHFIAWPILMPLGGIIAFFMAKKDSASEYGYMGKLMGYLWGAFTFTLLIIMANGFVIGWQNAYVFMIALVGLATFVSGGVLNFTPLKIGGWLAWALTAVALYTNMQIAVLCIALVMLGSYLIPGYMLSAKYGKKA